MSGPTKKDLQEELRLTEQQLKHAREDLEGEQEHSAELMRINEQLREQAKKIPLLENFLLQNQQRVRTGEEMRRALAKDLAAAVKLARGGAEIVEQYTEELRFSIRRISVQRAISKLAGFPVVVCRRCGKMWESENGAVGSALCAECDQQVAWDHVDPRFARNDDGELVILQQVEE
jgi:hypothetical protein